MPALDTSVCFIDCFMNGFTSDFINPTAGSLISLLDKVLINGGGSFSNITSITVSSNVATAVFSSYCHMPAGCTIIVSGATDHTEINNKWKVLSNPVDGLSMTFDAFGVADGTVGGTLSIKLAPLGWEKIFSGTNKAVYRSLNVNSNRHYLYVDDTGTTNARVTAYENMDSITVGYYPYPIISGGAYWDKAANGLTNRQWFIVGDDMMFYLGVSCQSGASNAAGYAQVHAFGDMIPVRAGDKYITMHACHPYESTNNTASYHSPITHMVLRTEIRRTLSRNCYGISLPIETTAMTLGARNESCFGGAPGFIMPNPADLKLWVSEVYAYENISGGSTIRCKYPGIYNPLCAMIATNSTHKSYLNDYGSYSKTLVYLLHLGGGAFYDLTGPWR